MSISEKYMNNTYTKCGFSLDGTKIVSDTFTRLTYRVLKFVPRATNARSPSCPNVSHGIRSTPNWNTTNERIRQMVWFTSWTLGQSQDWYSSSAAFIGILGRCEICSWWPHGIAISFWPRLPAVFHSTRSRIGVAAGWRYQSNTGKRHSKSPLFGSPFVGVHLG